MSTPNLLHKFKGCLLGALLGDCLGAPFEGVAHPFKRVDKLFEQLKDPNFKPPRQHSSGKLHYTDDTAQTKALATSLIQKGKIDTNDIGKRLSQEFFADMARGYGGGAKTILRYIHDNPKADVLQVAKAQFEGTGSYGNGAAMRVSPVALFYHSDTQQMIEAARQSARVTHAHRNGYNGAILQTLAIQKALVKDPTRTTDPFAFVQELRSDMEQLEETEETRDFCGKLDKVEEFLLQSSPPRLCHVADALGNDISSLNSVPAALFSYLIIQKLTEDPQAHNMFEQTVHYAVSLGGDADTIASMAGAICGAHVGYDGIPSHMVAQCEGNEVVAQLAEKLYQKSTKVIRPK